MLIHGDFVIAPGLRVLCREMLGTSARPVSYMSGVALHAVPGHPHNLILVERHHLLPHPFVELLEARLQR